MSKHFSDAELDELLAGITPGEWRLDMHGKFVGVKALADADVIGWNGFDSSDFSVAQQKANAAFIAAAPALIRQLRSERDNLRERLANAHDSYNALAEQVEVEHRAQLAEAQRERDELGREKEDAALDAKAEDKW